MNQQENQTQQRQRVDHFSENRPGTHATPPGQPRKSIIQLLDDKRVLQSFEHVAGKYLPAERIARLAVTCVKKTPKLAQCDPHTVLGAFMIAASLGLEPNTPLGQAYLIPRNSRRKNPSTGLWEDCMECNFQIGYRGFVTMIHRVPSLKSLQADVVYSGDHFLARKGSNSVLEHSQAMTKRGDFVGAYCYVSLRDGGEDFTILTMEDIAKIRDRSETYKKLRDDSVQLSGDKQSKAQKNLAETPWVLWFDEMSIKSVIKRHSKRMPADFVQVLMAAEIDSGGDVGKLDLGSFTDPDFAKEAINGEYSVHEGDEGHDDAKAEEAPAQAAETVRTSSATAAPAEKSDEAAPAGGNDVDLPWGADGQQTQQGAAETAAPAAEATKSGGKTIQEEFDME